MLPPDALVSNGIERYAIEVEMSLKNKHYYRRMLPRMVSQYRQVDAILYVMKDEKDMNWLMNQAKYEEKIFFTTLSELRTICCQLQFVNAKGEDIIELPREDNGSVLFHNPDDPYRNILLDCHHDRPPDEEFEQWLREGEDEYRRFAEEDRLREEQKKKQHEDRDSQASDKLTV